VTSSQRRMAICRAIPLNLLIKPGALSVRRRVHQTLGACILRSPRAAPRRARTVVHRHERPFLAGGTRYKLRAMRPYDCIFCDRGARGGCCHFETSITFAVTAFIVALAALLIHWATREAASAYFDAISTRPSDACGPRSPRLRRWYMCWQPAPVWPIQMKEARSARQSRYSRPRCRYSRK
jgi:hypothetical protein